MRNHPFITTLLSLRGNARGCVYSEPLWGIPYNLYAPYVSIYMLALGMTDSQIGLITSIGLVGEIFWTLLSGAITDKLGRKRTTLIFDILSWSVPCLIWAFAQSMTYFVVAALIHSAWRIVHTSWQCLLVEDTDPRLLVDIWSLINTGGLLVAFVAPLTGVLIERYTLVSTVRGLYLLAFVMMTAKFLVTNAMVTETQRGLTRQRETRNQPLFAVLGESTDVLRRTLRRPAILAVAGLIMVTGVYRMVRGAFWSILVTEQLLIPAQHLAFYPLARAVTMLLFYFLVMPRLRHLDTRKPMILGFVGLLASQVILISIPAQSYVLLLISTILEACSIPVVSTLLEKLIVLTVDPQERARTISLVYVMVIALTSPFGWLAGRLSEINRILPFALIIILFIVGGLLVHLAGRLARTRAAVEEVGQA